MSELSSHTGPSPAQGEGSTGQRPVLAPLQIVVRMIQLRGLAAAGHLWPDELDLLLQWYAGQLPEEHVGRG